MKHYIIAIVICICVIVGFSMNPFIKKHTEQKCDCYEIELSLLQCTTELSRVHMNIPVAPLPVPKKQARTEWRHER